MNNQITKGAKVTNYNSMQEGKNYILTEPDDLGIGNGNPFNSKVKFTGKSTTGNQYFFKENVGTTRAFTASQLNKIEVYSTNMRQNRPGKKTRKSRRNNRRNLSRRRR